MKINRRELLKMIGAATFGMALSDELFQPFQRKGSGFLMKSTGQQESASNVPVGVVFEFDRSCIGRSNWKE
jgi:hypothetical protein